MKPNKQAFTLIELLVVVLIIGILATVALPQYRLAVEKAHAAEALTQVRALAEAEKAYYLANGEYTNQFSDLDIGFNNQTEQTTDQVNQNHWYLSVRFAKSQSYVYAARGERERYNGRWYINYDLTNNIMYCVANSTDSISTKICKTYSSTSITCPWNKSEQCYKIP